MPQHHLHERRQSTLSELLEAVNARDPLTVVSSPPGSGKTFMLERGAVLAFHRGERVALATQTRAQADDVCRRLARAFPRICVVRFLAGKDEEVDLGTSVRNVRETKALPSGPCIVVATAAKWALVDVPPFDVVFVDEAWQMPWADLMLLGRVAPRFVLIGDPGQIEPTVTLETARWETLARAPHRAAPDVILADDALPTRHLRLPVTTRLPHDTTAIVRAFYDFEFDSWAAPGDRRLVLAPGAHGDGVDRVLERLRGGSIAALALPTPEAGPPAEEDRELAAHAAAVVQRLLARGARVQTEHGEHALGAEHVGMVATHRVMNARLVEALGPLATSVRVDTPERWQGLERPVMIAVHPLSGVTEPSSFDLSTGRLCVMTSRHSVACVLVTRDHVGETLRTHLPTADQPVGRPDAAGRGLARHRSVWTALERMDAVVAA